MHFSVSFYLVAVLRLTIYLFVSESFPFKSDGLRSVNDADKGIFKIYLFIYI